jgi:hypothetical protein
MRSVAVVKPRSHLVLFFALLVNLLLVSTSWAADTTVTTQVCNSSYGSTAQIGITSPVNDSIVNQNSVTLSGSLRDVTQIEVTIDGNYDQTVAIGSGQTSYSTTVNLAAGTHTIEVSGNDMCNISDPTESVVVTYEVTAQPTTGNETPTTTPTIPGTVNNPGSAPRRDPVETTSIPWLQQVPGYEVAAAAGRALDFDVMAKDGLGKAILRFVFFTLGVGLLALAPLVLRSYERGRLLQASVLQYMGSGLKAGGKAVSHLHRNVTTVRLLGVVLGLTAFII